MLTALSLVLSIPPPISARPTTGGILPDIDDVDAHSAYTIQLISRAVKLRRTVWKNRRVPQRGYKVDHDRMIRFEAKDDLETTFW